MPTAGLADDPRVVIEHDRGIGADARTTISTDGAPPPSINAEVSSLRSLVRVLQPGTCVGCSAGRIAAMADLGIALVPFRQRVLGQGGGMLQRSLGRYAPATRMVELVQLAATQ